VWSSLALLLACLASWSFTFFGAFNWFAIFVLVFATVSDAGTDELGAG
jgi:hypothetical protein